MVPEVCLQSLAIQHKTHIGPLADSGTVLGQHATALRSSVDIRKHAVLSVSCLV